MSRSFHNSIKELLLKSVDKNDPQTCLQLLAGCAQAGCGYHTRSIPLPEMVPFLATHGPAVAAAALDVRLFPPSWQRAAPLPLPTAASGAAAAAAVSASSSSSSSSFFPPPTSTTADVENYLRSLAKRSARASEKSSDTGTAASNSIVWGPDEHEENHQPHLEEFRGMSSDAAESSAAPHASFLGLPLRQTTMRSRHGVKMSSRKGTTQLSKANKKNSSGDTTNDKENDRWTREEENQYLLSLMQIAATRISTADGGRASAPRRASQISSSNATPASSDWAVFFFLLSLAARRADSGARMTSQLLTQCLNLIDAWVEKWQPKEPSFSPSSFTATTHPKQHAQAKQRQQSSQTPDLLEVLTLREVLQLELQQQQQQQQQQEERKETLSGGFDAQDQEKMSPLHQHTTSLHTESGSDVIQGEADDATPLQERLGSLLRTLSGVSFTAGPTPALSPAAGPRQQSTTTMESYTAQLAALFQHHVRKKAQQGSPTSANLAQLIHVAMRDASPAPFRRSSLSDAQRIALLMATAEALRAAGGQALAMASEDGQKRRGSSNSNNKNNKNRNSISTAHKAQACWWAEVCDLSLRLTLLLAGEKADDARFKCVHSVDRVTAERWLCVGLAEYLTVLEVGNDSSAGEAALSEEDQQRFWQRLSDAFREARNGTAALANNSPEALMFSVIERLITQMKSSNMMTSATTTTASSKAPRMDDEQELSPAAVIAALLEHALTHGQRGVARECNAAAASAALHKLCQSVAGGSLSGKIRALCRSCRHSDMLATAKGSNSTGNNTGVGHALNHPTIWPSPLPLVKDDYAQLQFLSDVLRRMRPPTQEHFLHTLCGEGLRTKTQPNSFKSSITNTHMTTETELPLARSDSQTLAYWVEALVRADAHGSSGSGSGSSSDTITSPDVSLDVPTHDDSDHIAQHQHQRRGYPNGDEEEDGTAVLYHFDSQRAAGDDFAEPSSASFVVESRGAFSQRGRRGKPVWASVRLPSDVASAVVNTLLVNAVQAGSRSSKQALLQFLCALMSPAACTAQCQRVLRVLSESKSLAALRNGAEGINGTTENPQRKRKSKMTLVKRTALELSCAVLALLHTPARATLSVSEQSETVARFLAAYQWQNGQLTADNVVEGIRRATRCVETLFLSDASVFIKQHALIAAARRSEGCAGGQQAASDTTESCVPRSSLEVMADALCEWLSAASAHHNRNSGNASIAEEASLVASAEKTLLTLLLAARKAEAAATDGSNKSREALTVDTTDAGYPLSEAEHAELEEKLGAIRQARRTHDGITLFYQYERLNKVLSLAELEGFAPIVRRAPLVFAARCVAYAGGHASLSLCTAALASANGHVARRVLQLHGKGGESVHHETSSRTNHGAASSVADDAPSTSTASYHDPQVGGNKGASQNGPVVPVAVSRQLLRAEALPLCASALQLCPPTLSHSEYLRVFELVHKVLGGERAGASGADVNALLDAAGVPERTEALRAAVSATQAAVAVYRGEGETRAGIAAIAALLDEWRHPTLPSDLALTYASLVAVHVRRGESWQQEEEHATTTPTATTTAVETFSDTRQQEPAPFVVLGGEREEPAPQTESFTKKGPKFTVDEGLLVQSIEMSLRGSREAVSAACASLPGTDVPLDLWGPTHGLSPPRSWERLPLASIIRQLAGALFDLQEEPAACRDFFPQFVPAATDITAAPSHLSDPLVRRALLQMLEALQVAWRQQRSDSSTEDAKSILDGFSALISVAQTLSSQQQQQHHRRQVASDTANDAKSGTVGWLQFFTQVARTLPPPQSLSSSSDVALHIQRERARVAVLISSFKVTRSNCIVSDGSTPLISHCFASSPPHSQTSSQLCISDKMTLLPSIVGILSSRSCDSSENPTRIDDCNNSALCASSRNVWEEAIQWCATEGLTQLLAECGSTTALWRLLGIADRPHAEPRQEQRHRQQHVRDAETMFALGKVAAFLELSLQQEQHLYHHQQHHQTNQAEAPSSPARRSAAIRALLVPLSHALCRWWAGMAELEVAASRADPLRVAGSNYVTAFVDEHGVHLTILVLRLIALAQDAGALRSLAPGLAHVGEQLRRLLHPPDAARPHRACCVYMEFASSLCRHEDVSMGNGGAKATFSNHNGSDATGALYRASESLCRLYLSSSECSSSFAMSSASSQDALPSREEQLLWTSFLPLAATAGASVGGSSRNNNSDSGGSSIHETLDALHQQFLRGHLVKGVSKVSGFDGYCCVVRSTGKVTSLSGVAPEGASWEERARLYIACLLGNSSEESENNLSNGASSFHPLTLGSREVLLPLGAAFGVSYTGAEQSGPSDIITERCVRGFVASLASWGVANVCGSSSSCSNNPRLREDVVLEFLQALSLAAPHRHDLAWHVMRSSDLPPPSPPAEFHEHQPADKTSDSAGTATEGTTTTTTAATAALYSRFIAFVSGFYPIPTGRLLESAPAMWSLHHRMKGSARNSETSSRRAKELRETLALVLPADVCAAVEQFFLSPDTKTSASLPDIWGSIERDAGECVAALASDGVDTTRTPHTQYPLLGAARRSQLARQLFAPSPAYGGVSPIVAQTAVMSACVTASTADALVRSAALGGDEATTYICLADFGTSASLDSTASAAAAARRFLFTQDGTTATGTAPRFPFALFSSNMALSLPPQQRRQHVPTAFAAATATSPASSTAAAASVLSWCRSVVSEAASHQQQQATSADPQQQRAANPFSDSWAAAERQLIAKLQQRVAVANDAPVEVQKTRANQDGISSDNHSLDNNDTAAATAQSSYAVVNLAHPLVVCDMLRDFMEQQGDGEAASTPSRRSRDEGRRRRSPNAQKRDSSSSVGPSSISKIKITPLFPSSSASEEGSSTLVTPRAGEHPLAVMERAVRYFLQRGYLPVLLSERADVTAANTTVFDASRPRTVSAAVTDASNSSINSHCFQTHFFANKPADPATAAAAAATAPVVDELLRQLHRRLPRWRRDRVFIGVTRTVVDGIFSSGRRDPTSSNNDSSGSPYEGYVPHHWGDALPLLLFRTGLDRPDAAVAYPAEAVVAKLRHGSGAERVQLSAFNAALSPFVKLHERTQQRQRELHKEGQQQRHQRLQVLARHSSATSSDGVRWPQGEDAREASRLVHFLLRSHRHAVCYTSAAAPAQGWTEARRRTTDRTWACLLQGLALLSSARRTAACHVLSAEVRAELTELFGPHACALLLHTASTAAATADTSASANGTHSQQCVTAAAVLAFLLGIGRCVVHSDGELQRVFEAGLGKRTGKVSSPSSSSGYSLQDEVILAEYEAMMEAKTAAHTPTAAVAGPAPRGSNFQPIEAIARAARQYGVVPSHGFLLCFLRRARECTAGAVSSSPAAAAARAEEALRLFGALAPLQFVTPVLLEEALLLTADIVVLTNDGRRLRSGASPLSSETPLAMATLEMVLRRFQNVQLTASAAVALARVFAALSARSNSSGSADDNSTTDIIARLVLSRLVSAIDADPEQRARMAPLLAAPEMSALIDALQKGCLDALLDGVADTEKAANTRKYASSAASTLHGASTAAATALLPFLRTGRWLDAFTLAGNTATTALSTASHVTSASATFFTHQLMRQWESRLGSAATGAAAKGTVFGTSRKTVRALWGRLVRYYEAFSADVDALPAGELRDAAAEERLRLHGFILKLGMSLSHVEGAWVRPPAASQAAEAEGPTPSPAAPSVALLLQQSPCLSWQRSLQLLFDTATTDKTEKESTAAAACSATRACTAADVLLLACRVAQPHGQWEAVLRLLAMAQGGPSAARRSASDEDSEHAIETDASVPAPHPPRPQMPYVVLEYLVEHCTLSEVPLSSLVTLLRQLTVAERSEGRRLQPHQASERLRVLCELASAVVPCLPLNDWAAAAEVIALLQRAESRLGGSTALHAQNGRSSRKAGAVGGGAPSRVVSAAYMRQLSKYGAPADVLRFAAATGAAPDAVSQPLIARATATVAPRQTQRVLSLLQAQAAALAAANDSGSGSHSPDDDDEREAIAAKQRVRQMNELIGQGDGGGELATSETGATLVLRQMVDLLYDDHRTRAAEEAAALAAAHGTALLSSAELRRFLSDAATPLAPLSLSARAAAFTVALLEQLEHRRKESTPSSTVAGDGAVYSQLAVCLTRTDLTAMMKTVTAAAAAVARSDKRALSSANGNYGVTLLTLFLAWTEAGDDDAITDEDLSTLSGALRGVMLCLFPASARVFVPSPTDGSVCNSSSTSAEATPLDLLAAPWWRLEKSRGGGDGKERSVTPRRRRLLVLLASGGRETEASRVAAGPLEKAVLMMARVANGAEDTSLSLSLRRRRRRGAHCVAFDTIALTAALAPGTALRLVQRWNEQVGGVDSDSAASVGAQEHALSLEVPSHVVRFLAENAEFSAAVESQQNGGRGTIDSALEGLSAEGGVTDVRWARGAAALLALLRLSDSNSRVNADHTGFILRHTHLQLLADTMPRWGSLRAAQAAALHVISLKADDAAAGTLPFSLVDAVGVCARGVAKAAEAQTTTRHNDDDDTAEAESLNGELEAAAAACGDQTYAAGVSLAMLPWVDCVTALVQGKPSGSSGDGTDVLRRRRHVFCTPHEVETAAALVSLLMTSASQAPTGFSPLATRRDDDDGDDDGATGAASTRMDVLARLLALVAPPPSWSTDSVVFSPPPQPSITRAAASVSLQVETDAAARVALCEQVLRLLAAISDNECDLPLGAAGLSSASLSPTAAYTYVRRQCVVACELLTRPLWPGWPALAVVCSDYFPHKQTRSGEDDVPWVLLRFFSQLAVSASAAAAAATGAAEHKTIIQDTTELLIGATDALAAATPLVLLSEDATAELRIVCITLGGSEWRSLYARAVSSACTPPPHSQMRQDGRMSAMVAADAPPLVATEPHRQLSHMLSYASEWGRAWGLCEGRRRLQGLRLRREHFQRLIDVFLLADAGQERGSEAAPSLYDRLRRAVLIAHTAHVDGARLTPALMDKLFFYLVAGPDTAGDSETSPTIRTLEEAQAVIVFATAAFPASAASTDADTHEANADDDESFGGAGGKQRPAVGTKALGLLLEAAAIVAGAVSSPVPQPDADADGGADSDDPARGHMAHTFFGLVARLERDYRLPPAPLALVEALIQSHLPSHEQARQRAAQLALISITTTEQQPPRSEAPDGVQDTGLQKWRREQQEARRRDTQELFRFVSGNARRHRLAGTKTTDTSAVAFPSFPVLAQLVAAVFWATPSVSRESPTAAVNAAPAPPAWVRRALSELMRGADVPPVCRARIALAVAEQEGLRRWLRSPPLPSAGSEETSRGSARSPSKFFGSSAAVAARAARAAEPATPRASPRERLRLLSLVEASYHQCLSDLVPPSSAVYADAVVSAAAPEGHGELRRLLEDFLALKRLAETAAAEDATTAGGAAAVLDLQRPLEELLGRSLRALRHFATSGAAGSADCRDAAALAATLAAWLSAASGASHRNSSNNVLWLRSAEFGDALPTATPDAQVSAQPPESAQQTQDSVAALLNSALQAPVTSSAFRHTTAAPALAATPSVHLPPVYRLPGDGASAVVAPPASDAALAALPVSPFAWRAYAEWVHDALAAAESRPRHNGGGGGGKDDDEEAVDEETEEREDGDDREEGAGGDGDADATGPKRGTDAREEAFLRLVRQRQRSKKDRRAARASDSTNSCGDVGSEPTLTTRAPPALLLSDPVVVRKGTGNGFRAFLRSPDGQEAVDGQDLFALTRRLIDLTV